MSESNSIPSDERKPADVDRQESVEEVLARAWARSDLSEEEAMAMALEAVADVRAGRS